MSVPARGGKMRAYFEFIAAVLYFFVARSFARGLAVRIHHDAWEPLIEQLLFATFLILGYAAFGSLFDRETGSIAAQGLPLRSGWTHEAGIGMAVGWGAVVVCVLAMVVIGGIAIVVTTQPSAWPWLIADAGYFALLALGEEVAFRGYGFQRFAAVVGSVGCRVWLRPVLCHRSRLATGVNECQHRHLCRLQLSADNGIFAYARPLAELGAQLCLEGVAGTYLWAGGQRRQQPLAGD